MRRLKIIGRRKPNNNLKSVQSIVSTVVADVDKASTQASSLCDATDKKLDQVFTDIANQVNNLGQSALIKELESVLDGKVAGPVTNDAPLKCQAPDLGVLLPVGSDDPNPDDAIDEISSASSCKSTLDNADILDFINITSNGFSSKQKLESPTPTDLVGGLTMVETNTLTENVIEPLETARFTITTLSPDNIQGFQFEVVSPVNFLHTSHLENVTGNKASIIINNLSNKSVTFGLQYLAIFNNS